MTYPISFVRPAPEPAAPAQAHEPAAHAAEPARTFGHALSSALHESSTLRDAAATRRARDERADAARRREASDDRRSAESRIDSPSERASHGSTRTPSHDADADARASARQVRDTSERDERAPDTRDRRDVGNVRQRTPSERDNGLRDGDRREAHAGGREPGTTFVGTPGARTDARVSASADRPNGGETPADEIEQGEDGTGAGARFIAQPLDAAMAPLPPLAVVNGSASLGAGIPAATPDSARDAESSAAPGVAAPAVTIDDSVIDEVTSAARRLVLEGASVRDPMAVHKEMTGLAPELRARLERVIDRMEQEYGYTVQVVETTRSQERQDALYAQGRTTPGEVVTWTRNSKHLGGNAADVVIDGGYGNAAGFERLARVARQEGLRTLWPRDPGHIELPSASPAAQGQAPDLAPRVARGSEGDVHILPVTGEAAMPSIPRAARSAIDPKATSPMPEVRAWRPGSERGVHILPTLPVGEEPHTLPFPTPAAPSVPRDASGADRGAASRLGTGGMLPSAAIDGGVARGTTAPSVGAGVATISGVAAVATPATVASVAQVAPVAQVAAVAQVATVATVAPVGGGLRGDGARPAAGAAGAEPAPQAAPDAAPGGHLAPAPVIANAGEQRHDMSGERRSFGERGEREQSEGAPSAPAGNDRGVTQAFAAHDATNGERGERGSSASPVAGLTRSDATERIARVLRIQEAANDRPMSSVLLRLDAPDGGEDRIRIDLRGQTVGTTLDIADPQAAAELRARAPELQQALQRQGLEGESMVVRTSSRSSDASVLNASAIASERDVARAASATASDGGGSTARDPRNPPRAYERDGTDQQRSRQRRDGKEGRR